MKIFFLFMLFLVGCNSDYIDIKSSKVANKKKKAINFLDGDYPGRISPSFIYSTGPNPSRILVKDFNGDGYLDFVTFDAGQLSFRFNDKHGDFSDIVPFYILGMPSHFDVGDIDDDGDLDLVITQKIPFETLVLLNDGTGNFSLDQTFSHTGPGSNSTVRLADMNGDGTLDLIYNDGPKIVIRFNSLGTFGPPSETVFQIANGNSWNDFSVGDVDGDGDLDVVSLDDGDNKLVVSKNDGAGNLSLEITTYSGSYPQTTYLKDMDNDGDLDMIYTVSSGGNNRDLIIRLNDGSGNFGSPLNYFLADTYFYGMEFVDLNGDNKLDIVFPKSGMYEICILLNTGSPNFGAAECFSSGTYPYDVKVVDLHNDGVKKIVAVLEGSSTVGIYSANPKVPIEAPKLSSPGVTVATISGDLDNDGDLDIVTSFDGGVQVRMNAGNGTFGAPIIYAGGTNHCSALGDLDNDGDLDIVTQDAAGGVLMVRYNDGNGNFGSVTNYSSGFGFNVELVDMNNDGFLDVLTSEYPSNVVLRLNDHMGGFGDRIEFPANEPRWVLGVDIDQDGFKDILFTSFSNNSITIYYSDTSGGYLAPEFLPTGNSPLGLSVGDINKDGTLDIVNSNAADGTLSIHLNQGNRIFSPPSSLLTEGQNFSVVLADLEGDDDLDILTADSIGETLNVFLNEGSGVMGRRRDYFSGSQPYGVHAADLNNDGVLDVLTGNINDSSTSIFIWEKN